MFNFFGAKKHFSQDAATQLTAHLAI